VAEEKRRRMKVVMVEDWRIFWLLKYPRDLLAAPRILLKMMNYERCWADIEPG
jgi:hypothetical protein